MDRVYARASQIREQAKERLKREVWTLRCVSKHLAFRGF